MLLPLAWLHGQPDKSSAASLSDWEQARIENWQPLWMVGYEPGTDEWMQLRMGGPMVEQRFAGEVTWGAVRPLWIDFNNRKTGAQDFHLLYPFFNYHRDEWQTRWDLFEVIRWSELRQKEGIGSRTFWAFPFVYWHRSQNEAQNYTGLFPFAGNVKSFLWYDELRWSFFPIYGQWRKGQTRRNFLPFPFVQWQEGPGAGGGALWPLMGHFWKEGDYDFQYMLWPLIYREVDQFEKSRPRVREGFLPFYAYEKSENVTDWTYIWPFFGWREEVEPAYSETRYFWPLFVQGRGKKYINRWAPFYTHSIVNGHDKTWYLWPFIREEKWVERDVLIDREQFLYFLIWDETQTSVANPALAPARKTHVWPLASYWDDGAGERQFQLFSPLEVFFPHNRVVRHQYTPLFAIYRWSEAADGARRESFLWDLITWQEGPAGERERLTIGPVFEYEASPERGGFDFFKGLIGWEREEDEGTLHLLWHDISEEDIPRGQGHVIRRGRRN